MLVSRKYHEHIIEANNVAESREQSCKQTLRSFLQGTTFGPINIQYNHITLSLIVKSQIIEQHENLNQVCLSIFNGKFY